MLDNITFIHSSLWSTTSTVTQLFGRLYIYTIDVCASSKTICSFSTFSFMLQKRQTLKSPRTPNPHSGCPSYTFWPSRSCLLPGQVLAVLFVLISRLLHLQHDWLLTCSITKITHQLLSRLGMRSMAYQQHSFKIWSRILKTQGG